MEIIDEPTRRGPYAGATGYYGVDGRLDTCITLRTALLKGGRAYFQAGGGVVAGSVPSLEYKETRNKAGAMVRALEVARSRAMWFLMKGYSERLPGLWASIVELASRDRSSFPGLGAATVRRGGGDERGKGS